MSLYWTPGKRIKRLPRFLWYPAIVVKNIFYIIRLGSLTQQVSYSHREAEVKLALGVEYVCGCLVPGDIAEFGTAAGNTAKIIAKAMKRVDNERQKKFHLFDSFQGLPKAVNEIDINSPMVRHGDWQEGVFLALDKIALKKMMCKYLPAANIVIYDGWFSETLKTIAPDVKFSMVHIDSDLYQSAVEILDYIFGQSVVQEGAIIFFDDYNGNYASPNLGERKAWSETITKYLINYSDAGDYGAGSKKFIIHGYKNKYEQIGVIN